MIFDDHIKVMIHDIITGIFFHLLYHLLNHFPDVTLSMFGLRCDYLTHDGHTAYVS